MLDQFFQRPHAADRLRTGPYGPRIEELAAYLRERGHTRNTARDYLWAAARFARWVVARKIALDVPDRQLIHVFVRQYTPRGGMPSPIVPRTVDAGVRHFLRMLRATGHAPALAKPTGPAEQLVAEYDLYLRDVAGLAPLTRTFRTRHARLFLRSVFGAGAIRWPQLRPEHVCSYVAALGRSGHFAAAAVAACSLRVFLRWLQFRGHTRTDLILAVPSFRSWKHATLPTVMTDAQVRSFLGAFDRTTAVGRRDYAMALCQVELGLRVGEVTALTLDDIDWRAGTIRVAPGKTRRGRLLPLPTRLGRAIAAYLRRDRPSARCRSVFVRHRLPVGAAVSRALVTGVVRRAFARTEGCVDCTGTHILRRTAATRMYRPGASLKEVADILGHRCLDTTAIYAKVDRDRLAAVAPPWPEGGQP